MEINLQSDEIKKEAGSRYYSISIEYSSINEGATDAVDVVYKSRDTCNSVYKSILGGHYTFIVIHFDCKKVIIKSTSLIAVYVNEMVFIPAAAESLINISAESMRHRINFNNLNAVLYTDSIQRVLNSDGYKYLYLKHLMNIKNKGK